MALIKETENAMGNNPYEFRNLVTGTMCCSAKYPKDLYPKCLARYEAELTANRQTTVAAATTPAALPPSAPDLVGAVRASRGLPPMSAPPAARPLGVAASGERVPDPPSLRDAILAGREKEVR